MDWASTGVGVLVSIGVGIFLWAFLPRGVVLTRAVRTKDATGKHLYDTWEIRNDSSLPIRVRSVRVVTPDTWNDTTESFDEPEMPWDGLFGVRLSLDDSTAEIARRDWQRPWSEVVVESGDTLTAHVPNNTSVYVDYRRAGWSGLLERRHLVVHGEV